MSSQITNIQFRLIASEIEESLQRHKSGNAGEGVIDTLIERILTESVYYNTWFIQSHVEHALEGLVSWLKKLDDSEVQGEQKTGKLGVLLNTQAPLEGFEEILSYVKTGYTCIIRPDDALKRITTDIISLFDNFPLIKGRLQLEEGRVKDVDAYVTFSNKGDTFKTYFDKYSLIDLSGKGRSVTLTGDETPEQLSKIAEGVCMYFGRARNSIKELIVPHDYDINKLLEPFNEYSSQLQHNRYYNNYEYRKSAMLVSKLPFTEMGPLLITKETSQVGFTGVLYVSTSSPNPFS